MIGGFTRGKRTNQGSVIESLESRLRRAIKKRMPSRAYIHNIQVLTTLGNETATLKKETEGGTNPPPPPPKHSTFESPHALSNTAEEKPLF